MGTADRTRLSSMTFARIAALLSSLLLLTGLLPRDGCPSEESAGVARPAKASPLASLVSEIVPDEGPARPPYQPARYDLGLTPESEGRDRTIRGLRAEAAARQARLERVWRRLKAQRPPLKTPADEAAWQLLDYAFGQGTPDDALAAARRAGPAARLRLARLLLAECRYSAAVRELAALAGGSAEVAGDRAPSAVADRALALLVRHQVQREALSKHVSLVPLEFDLEGYLKSRSETPSARRLISALRQTAPATSRPSIDGELVEEEIEILEEEIVQLEESDPFADPPPAADDPFAEPSPDDDDPFGEPAAGNPFAAPRSDEDDPFGLSPPADTDPFGDDDPTSGSNEPSGERAWNGRLPADVEDLRDDGISVDHLKRLAKEFAIYRKDQEWIRGDRAQFQLFSLFNGPLSFRLYRFAGQDEWEQVTAAKLAGMEPERTWTGTYRPLAQNNRVEPEERTLTVGRLREGHYLLCVEARYAPMVAACKFCVNNVALYLRAGRNQGVLVAVDRRSGAPVPDVPLELAVTGSPDVGRIFPDAGSAEAVLLRRGFLGHPADDEGRGTVLSASRHLEHARLYTRGADVRQRFPDFKQTHRLRTAGDGTAHFALDLGRPEYRYVLAATRRGEGPDAAGLSSARLEYQEPEPRADETKAVVWLAQPIHRPGSTVHFKGIVRGFNGVRVADHDPDVKRAVAVAVRNPKETLWEGDCTISPAGTFWGSFQIPLTAALGHCRFEVDGVRASPSVPLTVAEFRLPTYHVELSVPGRSHAGGELLKGHASVTYYSGKPAIGAEVEVVLETGEQDPPTVIELTGQDGRIAFSISLPQAEARRSFTVRATAMDASGQSYGASSRVLCEPNPFQVSVSTANFAAVHGEVIEVGIAASTWTGQPIAGATVAVDGVKQSASTDENGKATLPLAAAKTGTHQQIGVTVIADGRVVRDTSCLIQLHKEPKPQEEEPGKPAPETQSPPDPLPPPAVSWRSFPGQIDAGQPLSFSLHVEGPPNRRNTIAVFAENDRLLTSQVLRVLPGEHRVTIPTRRDWAPSLQVAVVLLDGRHGRAKTQACYLRPTDRFLTLQVETDRVDYKPGEKCTAVVTATDHEGRGVPRAEISLGVVDEAIYDVRRDPTPDLQQFFYQYHLPYLCREGYDAPAPKVKSLWYWLGPQSAWRFRQSPVILQARGIRMSAGGGAYGGTALAPPIRRKFVNTAYWVADLITGTDGKARTTFDFPDNLTSWRFTARGVTADTRVGEIRVNHRTFLPLEVDFALPRGFRAGDRIDLPVVLHNNTEQPRTVRGTTRINQGDEQPWPARRLVARADDRLTIPLTALSTKPMTLFASVGDPETGDADAVERKLVPLKRGHRFTRAYSGPLGKDVVIAVDPGVPWTEDGLVLTVRREAGLAGPVASALDELIQYPYGCVEQTMSRFMPAVVAARALEAAGIDNPAAGRLPDVIAKGLARLADCQHRDGGWGWWKDDATNDFMTAYVLLGLARCRQTGERVPDRMIDNGQRYLIGRLQKGQLAGHRPGSVGDVNLAVYAAYALATLYHQDSEAYAQGLQQVAAAVKSVQDGATKLGLLDEILMGNTWHLLGDRRQARAYLVRLEDKVTPESGNRSTICATAGLLELGAALEPKGPRWRRLARQLVSARRGTGWGDTLTTSAAVRGLAAVLAVPRRDDVPVVVGVDGRERGILPPGDDDSIRLELPSVDRVSLHPSKPGCADFYSVRVEGYLERAPANPAKPAVTLRTRTFRLQPARVELVPDGSGRLDVPRGVTLEVQVEIELKRATSHTRLTVPRPCGVELVRSPKPAAGVVATEQRDDALHFFVDRWEKGTHQVGFLARAEVSGSVSVPLPEFVPMYDDTQPTAVFAPTCWTIGPNDQ